MQRSCRSQITNVTFFESSDQNAFISAIDVRRRFNAVCLFQRPGIRLPTHKQVVSYCPLWVVTEESPVDSPSNGAPTVGNFNFKQPETIQSRELF